MEQRAQGLRCRDCSMVYPTDRGVTDFLLQPHPAVARERAAMAELDSKDEEFNRSTLELLDKLEADSLSADELRRFPCFRHAAEARRRIIELLHSVPLAAGELLVELGAAHCWASGLFLQRGCRVVAVDITEHLHLARRAGDERLWRIKADMNRLPLRDGAADVVWSTASAHHSWSLAATLAEAARVLRPGGRLALCCEPMPSLLRWLAFGCGAGFGRSERKAGINERLWRRGTWLRLCRRAGLLPKLIFPSMEKEELVERLGRYRLPGFLAAPARPALRLLQVSIHLVADKPDIG